MKKLLILLLSFTCIFGYGQTVIDPSQAPTVGRINIALQEAITLSGTDTYTATKAGVSYTTGYAYDFTFTNANTGTSPTINLSLPTTPSPTVLGAKSIRKYSAGSLVAVAANDLKGTMRLRYDGTYFVLDGIGNLAIAGSDTQIQVNNSGAFGASSNLSYNNGTNTFRAATGLTISGTGSMTDNFYLGADHSNTTPGGNSSKWNMLIGENLQINNSNSLAAPVNDCFLLGGFYNKLNITSTSTAGLQNTGIIGSYNSIIESDILTFPGGYNGDIMGAIILGGQKNKISPSYSNGTSDAIAGNWILGGGRNISDGHGSGAFGYWSQSSGAHSIVHGYVTTFFGGRQHAPDATFDPDRGSSLSHTGTVPRILASGKHAINMSANSPEQVSGHGVTGDYAGAFAGRNHHVTGVGSVAIGGYAQTVTDSATVAVSNLQISTKPIVNDTITHLLVIEDGTGKVKRRNVSSISAPNATSSIRGISKLYTSTGSNTDGTMDQNSINKALTDVLNSVDTATYWKRLGTTTISNNVYIYPNVTDTHSLSFGGLNRFANFGVYAGGITMNADSWTSTTDNFNVYSPGGESTFSCGLGGIQLLSNSATTPLEIISGSSSQPVRIKGGSTTLIEANGSNARVLTLTTPTTNDDPTVDFWQKRATTTGASVTTLMTVPTTTDNTILITGFIIARRTGGASGTAGDGAGYRFEGVFKNVSGAVTQLGATITTIGESQAGWDVTLPISSSNILVSVTGATSNSITWHLSEIKIMSLNQ